MGIPINEAEGVMQAIREEFYGYVPPIVRNNPLVVKAISESTYRILEKIVACGWGPARLIQKDKP